MEKNADNDVYRRLGVVPIINCTGTRTTYGGSNPTQNVIDAMTAAARSFVDLDELAEAVGARIAELTGAEWGIVTAGSTAALVLAAAASIAGNDPEMIVRLPDTTGRPADIIVIKTHRFPYDLQMRQVGARLVEVTDRAGLDAALQGRVAMICLLARAEPGAFIRLEELKQLAGAIPIVVDAASFVPANPDPWLSRGADLAIYSGGKSIRGPQSTGFLIGRKALCEAAWLNGPPHNGVGRAMKIGKEEIVGAITALDDWLMGDADGRNERQHDGWLNILSTISESLTAAPIEHKILPARRDLGSVAPRLHLSWSNKAVSGDALSERVFETHRVKLQDFWVGQTSLMIDPLNIQGRAEAEIVGGAIAAAFDELSILVGTSAQRPAEISDITGRWHLDVEYLNARSSHELHLQHHSDGTVSGFHLGRFAKGQVSGTHADGKIELQSKMPSDPMSIYFAFSGELTAVGGAGTLTTGAAMDEHSGIGLRSQFGVGTWSATRAE